MQDLVLVNAWPDGLKDEQIEALVEPLQTQFDRDFVPAWERTGKVHPVKVSFADVHAIQHLPARSWPLFFNKHSRDPGALGWHTDNNAGLVFSRVFVGDCIRFGLNWHTTASHEALEIALNPHVNRVWRMPTGRLAALEAADAVEADDLAYDIGGFMMSNFVLPYYFSTDRRGPFDFRKILKAPCPALTAGGYQSVTDAGGDWIQKTLDRADGLAGRRALLNGHRRQARSQVPLEELEIF